MQGYIINITPQKNEDIITTILTPTKIKKLYRFYGAKHSIIQLGKKIDFEVEYNGVFLPKLRNITGLNFPWERDINRLRIWQYYLQLLHKHFFDIEEIDKGYYQILDYGAGKLYHQNPIRVILEMYAMLLHLEGRVPNSSCFICTSPLEDHIHLARAFLPAHTHCIHSPYVFNKDLILQYLHQKSTIFLNDTQIQHLWQILIQGI
ncbi:recombination protein RecO [Helicobacter sp. faydin-H20]|uniref:recombination protein RecO n=1 Tax=Helicobacter anatolicus TaxID=2905874 RepID=UPI001E2FE0EA|nr:recombination protein RecO [Helicobacter anatolicus]MCE3037453.1 recombination protein RecO [Helicobacter anatolicus]